MWYYTISRLYLGRQAKRKRWAMANSCGFTVEPTSAMPQISFRCQRKELLIQHCDAGEIRVLFSYLRYALRGQLRLLQHIRTHWPQYFTLWRSASRRLIKAELAPIGASLFKPHTLGADNNGERILVPGDAELQSITLLDHERACLRIQIRWVDWSFHWRKALKFVRIQRSPQTAIWMIEATFRSHHHSTQSADHNRHKRAREAKFAAK